MDFIKNIRNKTAKLRSLGKRLFTRRSIGRIAPSHVQELAALDPTAPSLSQRQPSLSPTTKVVTHIQKSFRKRKNTRQAIADLSKINSKRLATRRIQKKFRKALANPNLEECSICSGTMLYPRLTKTLRCGHKFHRKCIEQWNAINPSCPLCRIPIQIPGSANVNTTNVNNANVNTANVNTANVNTTNVNNANVNTANVNTANVNTINAINRANALIDNMRYATTFDQATRFMNASTRVINSLPRNGNAFRQLADRQWATWLQVYARVSAPIQNRTVNPSITVNGITSEEYENLIHGR
jgi:hypothetical protein